MKITTALMQGVADIFTASKKRKDAEYADFLLFYRDVVENTGEEVSKAIGKVVPGGFAVTGHPKVTGTANMYITVADYLWWKQHISEGLRFQNSTLEQVKMFMLSALAKAAESNGLNADERKALMALLDQ